MMTCCRVAVLLGLVILGAGCDARGPDNVAPEVSDLIVAHRVGPLNAVLIAQRSREAVRLRGESAGAIEAKAYLTLLQDAEALVPEEPDRVLARAFLAASADALAAGVDGRTVRRVFSRSSGWESVRYIDRLASLVLHGLPTRAALAVLENESGQRISP